jgi:subtilisin family serine protease
LVVLALAALALAGGASAGGNAPSMTDLIVGYDHAPTAADKAAIANNGGNVRREFKTINALAISLPSGKAGSLNSEAGVTYVEADAVRTPQSLSGTLPTSQLAPSLSNGLYGLLTTNAAAAQSAGYKGAGVKACVADTGLDTRHPDIAPNLVNTYDVKSGTAGLHASDVFDLGVEATETHATHVAGIVAGADNGLGIRGVAPSAKLYHARVLFTQEDGSVSGETSEVMAGVLWLAQQGCKVINMSLGGGDRSQAEEALYNNIIQAGTTIVVATGNDSASQLSFPGRYQNVISVGAVDRNNQLASFSNTGAQIDLVGPGVDNLSSFPDGQGRDSFLTIGSQTYSANPIDPAGATPVAGITAPLVNCGLAGTTTSCHGAPAGFIALIQRGSFSFNQKVTNVMAQGAAMAVIYNNAANGPGNFNGGLFAPDNNGTPWIPAISLSQTDGEAIAAAAPPTATGYNVAMAWNNDSGTSMATPHVTGVVALLLGKNSKLKPQDIDLILKKSATDLGVPNYDTTYGNGLVNATAALALTP